MGEAFVPARYKLTIEDYHKLGEVGILDEASRVELIEGELFEMPPIGGPHAWAVNRLNRILIEALGRSADLSIQGPILIPPYSEPQPDIVIVQRGTAARENRAPKPEEVLLVIEVADTTLRYDRGAKLRLYAKAGIPEFWIVNVRDACVEMYSNPSVDSYDDKSVATKTERVAPHALPGVSIEVSAIFESDS